jgi:hypothetical protein
LIFFVKQYKIYYNEEIRKNKLIEFINENLIKEIKELENTKDFNEFNKINRD